MHLRPSHLQDISAMADILADCNVDDAVSRHLRNDIFKYWTSYRKGGIRFLIDETLIPGAASWVLETDEGDLRPDRAPGPGGEIVGWAQCHRAGTSPVARNWQKPGEAWDKRLETALQSIKRKYYSYIDPVDNRDRFPEMMAILTEPFDQEVFAEAWELSGLYVRREYQRRGLAKIMLRWGLEQARAARVPVFVRSSPAGIKAYEQNGFRVFEKVEFGFNPGGRGINKLVWEPPEMEGQWFDRAQRKAEANKEEKGGGRCAAHCDDMISGRDAEVAQ